MVDGLLQEIVSRGWTEENARRFVQQHDGRIKSRISYEMVKMGFIKDEKELQQLRRQLCGSGPATGVKSYLLDIAQNAYSDLYIELASTRLIRGYLTGLQRGEIEASFEAYINGVIRNKIRENAEKVGIISHRRLSEKEIFDRLVESKKPVTKRQLIGQAKARFADEVRSYLLSEYPEPIDNVVDYFFEQFCEQAYIAIKDQVKGRVLTQLLMRFTRADYERGLSYRARIPPLPEPQQASPPKVEDEEELSEEELMSLSVKNSLETFATVNLEALRARRSAWWNQLLQGRELDPEELKKQIPLYRAVKEMWEKECFVLCLACASLMRKGSEATKRDIRIFLVYHFSQCGKERERPPTLDANNLALPEVEGCRFSWEEASKLFGKQADYSAHARIKKKIGQEFMTLWQQIFEEEYPLR